MVSVVLIDRKKNGLSEFTFSPTIIHCGTKTLTMLLLRLYGFLLQTMKRQRAVHWPASTALFELPPLPQQIKRDSNSVAKEQSLEAFWED